MSSSHPEPRVLDRDRLLDDAMLGAAAGLMLGWLDAAQLLLTAGQPVLRAAYKVPLHVIWVSPMLAAPVVMALAVVTGIAARSDLRIRPSGAVKSEQIVVGMVTFVVVFLAAWVLRLLHPASVVVLALSAALTVARLSGSLVRDPSRWLRGPLLAAGGTLPILALYATAYPRIAEQRDLQNLPSSAGGYNVIFLVLDTVRRDRFYRPDGVVVAPALEAFSSEARWFSNAWATSSWSLPSQATLLTGLSPSEHGADWPALHIADGVVPVAVHLAERGMVAAAFSGNDSWVVPEYLGAGFVRFQSLTIDAAGQRSIIGRFARPLRRLLGRDELSGGLPADVLLDNAFHFAREQAGRPFFIYVCLMDVNRDYYETALDSPAWQRAVPLERRVAAYDSALTEVDRAFALFIGRLRTSGLLDRTVLVVTSDHGESFGAGYAQDHDPVGHGTGLYPEQLRVPLWIRSPDGSLRGVEERPVSLEGVAGTALFLASQADSSWRRLPLDTASVSPPVHFSLHYGDRRLSGRIDGSWLRLLNFQHSPPIRDSVSLVPRDGSIGR